MMMEFMADEIRDTVSRATTPKTIAAMPKAVMPAPSANRPAGEVSASRRDWSFRCSDSASPGSTTGATKSSVRFEGGLQADLRVVPVEQFAFALHHFTGSKDHNVAMRQRALARGYSLSEWGFKEVGSEESEVGSEGHGITTEQELFKFLGFAEIPPELREGLGELENLVIGEDQVVGG